MEMGEEESMHTFHGDKRIYFTHMANMFGGWKAAFKRTYNVNQINTCSKLPDKHTCTQTHTNSGYAIIRYRFGSLQTKSTSNVNDFIKIASKFACTCFGIYGRRWRRPAMATDNRIHSKVFFFGFCCHSGRTEQMDFEQLFCLNVRTLYSNVLIKFVCGDERKILCMQFKYWISFLFFRQKICTSVSQTRSSKSNLFSRTNAGELIVYVRFWH